MSSTERDTGSNNINERSSVGSKNSSEHEMILNNLSNTAIYHSHFKDSKQDVVPKGEGVFHKIQYMGESELFFTFKAVEMGTALPVVMKAMKVSLFMV